MKTNKINEIEFLKTSIKHTFSKPLNSLKSFEELSDATQLSVQTLRRFFGKIDVEKNISNSSLSLLCKYIGFNDWDEFLAYFENKKDISETDRIFIENMAVFFKNGEKYNINYHQNTLTADTLNDYAKVIFSKKENIEYFYELYHENNWATDYMMAWIPNYNFYGQNWYRKILLDKSQKTNVAHVKLSQTNFLFFGAFLTKENVDFTPETERLYSYYLEYKRSFLYMPYHEMRFCTVQLMEAKKQNNQDNFYKILNEYLQNLKAQNFEKFYYQEMIIVLCNTLIWLQEFEIAYNLLKKAKSYIKNYQKSPKAFHYYGMNMVFIKTTFAIIYLANGKKNIGDFEVTNSEFNDFTDLLYHDYVRILFYAKAILEKNSLKQKQLIYKDLKPFVQKSGYVKIYDVLEGLDPLFSEYFSE